MISGVCGGLAEYLNIDPVVVRLIFVITAIFGASIGFWVYIIMWIAVPEQPAP
jgi:phage shock protein C